MFDINNGTYKGEWYNDQRDGQGKFTYADGTIYNGGWSAGLK